MKYTAIDLFSGAGGLSLGLTLAGWSVLDAFELDPTALATHAANLKLTRHHCDDVRRVDFRPFRGRITLVAGGPPCQPFSVSGKQLGLDDVRDMVPHYVRAVDEIRPTAFLMENVSGLASPRFHGYLEETVERLECLGYDVSWQVLNSADYGVPQKRLRLFIVGVPKGTSFHFPKPTHGSGRKKPYVTVGDALADCPEDEPNRAKVVYAKNPVLRKSSHSGMLLNGKGRPLDVDAPSLTIPASAGGNRTHVLDPKGILKKYHAQLMKGGAPRSGVIADCRRLTVRESARLQSFPDSFDFQGRRNQKYGQIGNAVPPTFARAVGESILKAISGQGVAKKPNVAAKRI
ncbi:MAG: DNA cytosine methyltransferase [Dokdonella sp.]